MPKLDIRIGPVVLRRQPPVVGLWCSPPTSTKATRTHCVYDNHGCAGDSKTCDLCEFPYCASHYPRHKRRFECPVDVWVLFNRRRLMWYDRVKSNPKTRPKVDVHFPDTPPEAVDG